MTEAPKAQLSITDRFFWEKRWNYVKLPITIQGTFINCVMPAAGLKEGDFYAHALTDAVSVNKAYMPKHPDAINIAVVDSTEDFNYFYPGKKKKGDYINGTASQNSARLTILTPQAMLTDTAFPIIHDPKDVYKNFRYVLAHELNHIFVLNAASPRHKDLPEWLLEGITNVVVDKDFQFPRRTPRTFTDNDLYMKLNEQNGFPDKKWLKGTFLGNNESPVIYRFSQLFTKWFIQHYEREGCTIPDFLEKFGHSEDPYQTFFEQYFQVNMDEAYGQFLKYMEQKLT